MTTQPLHIDSAPQFHTLLKTHHHVIADFYAHWCPPCRQIAPVFEQLATTYSLSPSPTTTESTMQSTTASTASLAFAKVNIDRQQRLAAQYGVSAMPTFLLFREGRVVDSVRGASPGVLQGMVERIVGESGESTGEKEDNEDGEGEKEREEEEGGDREGKL